VWYHATRNPGALALESADTGATLTWRQLEDRVAHAAGLLRSLGIGADDRVALVAENDVRVFELQFACMRVGAIMTPLNWRLAPVELEALCADADPRIMVHDARWAELGQHLVSGVGVPTLTWGNVAGGTDYELGVAGAPPVSASSERTFDDPTHILYTSGTTGRPKGALVTNGTLFWQWANTAHVSSLTGYGSKYFNPLPLFHAGGLTTLAAPMLFSGGCVAVSRRFDPELCLAWLGDPAHMVTHFNGPPIIWQAMTEAPGFSSADFSGLQHAHIAGSVMPLALFTIWSERGVGIQQHYGGTEMGPTATALPANDMTRKVGSCGLPVMHTRIRLVDDAGNEVSKGEAGEIWLNGPSITPGYWRRQRDPNSFVNDWFRTGDCAVREDEGYFYIADRLKDMFKSGGESVFPAEIEQILIEMPAIAEVAVIGVADSKWGEVGRAIVVASPGGSVTVEDIGKHLDARLAPYKIPKSVVQVGSLSRNALGKVDKKELRTQYGSP
jgi:fatty-acyl-CoA synthase